MKKGFTLIELLMIIVILGVIITITAPILINLNRNATIETYKKSVNGIERAAQNYYDRNYILDGTMEVNPMFDGTTNLYDELILDGEKPNSATVFIDEEGNIQIYASFDIINLCKVNSEINEVVDEQECL